MRFVEKLRFEDGYVYSLPELRAKEEAQGKHQDHCGHEQQ